MKLHELLAVENSLETQATKTRTDLAATFEKKRHLFEEKRVTFTPSDEKAGSPVTESQSDLQSTVTKELNWAQGFIEKALDASFQVAEANTKARADVELEDGTKLLADVPATALLELEKRVTEIKELLSAIPTLDPAKGFSADSSRGEGVFMARDVMKTRTRKAKKVYTKYEPRVELPNLPAQTELVDEDVPVGTIRELEWSGLITPAQKADLINRAEIIFRAVRRARSRANDTTVDTSKKIGGALLKFIFAGTTK